MYAYIYCCIFMKGNLYISLTKQQQNIFALGRNIKDYKLKFVNKKAINILKIYTEWQSAYQGSITF